MMQDEVTAQIIDLLFKINKNQEILIKELSELKNTVIKWDTDLQNELAKSATEET